MAENVCKKCGAVLQPGMKFCIECGEPIPAEPAAQAAPVAAAAPIQPPVQNAQPSQGYIPPQQPVQPRRPESVAAAAPVTQNGSYAGGAAFVPPVAPAGGNFTYQQPAAVDQKPPKGSPYEPISSWGYVGISLLMSLPVIGVILTIVWACGGCTKINKRNYARSFLLMLLLAVIIVVVLAILFVALGWTDQLQDAVNDLTSSSYYYY